MSFWFFSIALTLIALFIVLFSLTRPVRKPAGNLAETSQGFATVEKDDVSVYRAQMREVAADSESGALDAVSAQEARMEIARRIMQAEKAAAKEKTLNIPLRGRRIIVLLSVLCVPLVAWGIYALIGSPEMSSQPLAQRLNADPQRATLDELVLRAERHLEENPNDARGWDVLAPIYLRIGRVDDAIRAYQTAIQQHGENFPRLLGLAEALTIAAQGVVTPQARALFEQASVLEPRNPQPQLFIAQAMAQAGELGDAAEFLRQFNQNGNLDIAARQRVTKAIQSLEEMQAGPERMAMIEGMVASLRDKLRDNPADLDGWKRLLRSYLVLQRPQDALAALQQGLAVLPEEKKAQLLDYARGQGMKTQELQP